MAGSRLLGEPAFQYRCTRQSPSSEGLLRWRYRLEYSRSRAEDIRSPIQAKASHFLVPRFLWGASRQLLGGVEVLLKVGQRLGGELLERRALAPGRVGVEQADGVLVCAWSGLRRIGDRSRWRC